MGLQDESWDNANFIFTECDPSKWTTNTPLMHSLIPVILFTFMPGLDVCITSEKGHRNASILVKVGVDWNVV